ncbi:hypothetical protein NQ318_001316 [Aromia moschata]|uniref:Uncharacterized protein n=1 Tax=Aromia moschata TaxID=1265417 RepID=A0AAV8ZG44_9CUCU|nr:hypothetical protein NQ318_001316 [Aromia moschata]
MKQYEFIDDFKTKNIKLEDTKQQVQREILEKIEGLGHQLHRTSIADSGDYSTSPGIPLQNSTLMHAERSVHKMLKPPTYDGQSSWSMYRRQFEAAAKANGWTSQEMATSLVISLRGQALEILQSIPEEQQNDYDRIIGALEIRYGHKYLRQVYQSQIKSRQQRSNESLQEYEADIERLIHLAYPQAPKEFLEQIGIQTFIDGLVDTEMQQALRLGRHTTINEWSSEELKKSQKKDSDLKLIRNWLKNGVRPTWQEVSRYGTTIKGYWAQWSSLCLRDGLLHRKWESPDGVSAVYQLVLPKARIHQVLEELHSSPSGGHFGVTRTLARHESTTYTPSMLTSGREMKLPTDLMLGRPLEETEERSLPEFVEDLRKRMDRIHRFAREKLKIHSDKMKQRLDTTSTETAFKPGDAVWLYAPKRMKGRSPKLQKNWEGPYTIIKKINDLVYRIQLSPRSKPKVVHLERLARYTGHDPPDWFVVEDPPPRTEDSVIRDE